MRPLAARLTVFVASPGDTQEERDRLDTIVAELNRGIARDRGLVLELVRWETHARPGIRLDAQDVINRQVPVPDLVIGVFWKRLGTPTPRAALGTAEEIALAVERWRKAGDVEILRLAGLLSSPALRGDGVLSLAGAALATVTLASLVLNAAFGWWWSDAVAALAISLVLLREGGRVLASSQRELGGVGADRRPATGAVGRRLPFRQIVQSALASAHAWRASQKA